MGATGPLYASKRGRIARLLAALLALLFAAPPPGTVRADPAKFDCPLLTRNYKARLVQAVLTGAVDEEVALRFTLEPPQPPVGFFLSVNMKLLQSPGPSKEYKPDILTGFPETSAVFRTPGTYTYAVVVSLVAKSSCGGAKADTIFNGQARVHIAPSPSQRYGARD